MNQYEAMFIFNSTFAGEAGKVEAEIDRLMQRAGAEIVVSKKWEERKLAYEIKKQKRGCYYLTYFRAPPDKIPGIERDCSISDDILRVLILRADGLSREHIEATYPVPGQPRFEDSDDRGPERRGPMPRRDEIEIPSIDMIDA